MLPTGGTANQALTKINATDYNTQWSNVGIATTYVDMGTNPTALSLTAEETVLATISASTTFTSTVPAAGARGTVIIFTSGTTSRTVTFGTGFKSQGTLSTGTTASRYWIVNFISNGTSWLETSRTTTAYA